MDGRIGEIMVHDPVSAGPQDTVATATGLMTTHRIKVVPVVDNAGGPIGIVSPIDLLSGFPPETPLAEVMTCRVWTIGREQTVREAAALMREHRVTHLPVMDGERLVGMLSSFDLLRALGAAAARGVPADDVDRAVPGS